MSPQGDEIKIIVQLYFKPSNNEVEYDTLLASLRVARYVGAVKIIVYLDL